MAKSLDLYIDQGSDFIAVLPPVTNPNGSVVDLTGFVAFCMIRRSYTNEYAVQVTATITDPTHGIISLSLTDNETAGLQASVLHTSRWVYDVVIDDTNSNDALTRVFEGLVIINPSVSAKPATILLTPYVPEDYGGI